MVLRGASGTKWYSVVSAVLYNWSEETIRNMDKANGLTRITRYVTFVGRVRMTDHLTKELRCKPLLMGVMFRRMMEGGRSLEASPDARQERS